MLELLYRMQNKDWKHESYFPEEERDRVEMDMLVPVTLWRRIGVCYEYKIVEAPLRTIKTMWRYRNEDDWIEETLTEWNPHRIKEIRKKMRVFGKHHRRAGDKEYRWRIVEVED